MTIISAVIIGIAFGAILQGGKLCMNLVCGGVTYVTEPTGFKAYILALAVAALGVGWLESAGLVENLLRNDFSPVGNILGGLIFGIGMVMAEGCGAAIWYKAGEGSIPSWAAIFGFMFSLSALSSGTLGELTAVLSGPILQASGGEALTLYNIPSLAVNKWAAIAVFVAVCAWFLSKRKSMGMSWVFTGIGIGVVVISAWYATTVWGEEAGISASGPSRDLMLALTGAGGMSWGAYFIISVPFGAYLSALLSGKFRWKSGTPQEFLKTFSGGCIMGAGAAIAGGCNIRYGLSQFSLLTVSGVVTTLAIFMGHYLMTALEQRKQEHAAQGSPGPKA